MADTLYCSFCGKSQHEVRKLVAGPGNFICNECIDLCHGIVHDKPSPPPLRASDDIAWFEWTMRVDRIERALMDLRLAINDARYKRYQPPPDQPPAEIVSFAKPDAEPPAKPDDDEPRLRDIHIGFGKLDDDDPSEKS